MFQQKPVLIQRIRMASFRFPDYKKEIILLPFTSGSAIKMIFTLPILFQEITSRKSTGLPSFKPSFSWTGQFIAPVKPSISRVLSLKKQEKSRGSRPGESTIVTFRDVNSQEVAHQTFTTNDFGSFNGSFVAPQGVLSGQMSISNGSGSASFQVEEYKRPTFEVTFNPLEGNYRLNDSLTVTGKAMAYAGNNIDGAMVKYRVVRSVHFPYYDRWWYPFPVLPEVEISQGEIKNR